MNANPDFLPRKTWRGEAATTEKKEATANHAIWRESFHTIKIARPNWLQKISFEQENAEETEIFSCVRSLLFPLRFFALQTFKVRAACAHFSKKRLNHGDPSVAGTKKK